MENKSIETIQIQNVNQKEKPKKTIMTKPYFAIYSCITISLLLIISQKIAILGYIILPFALLVLWKVPNKKQLEFYDDYLLIYSEKNKEMCEKIEYKNIVEWVVRQGQQGGDCLIFRLEGNIYKQVESFRAVSIVRELNAIIPEKEANRKKNSEMKNTAFKWPWGGKK